MKIDRNSLIRHILYHEQLRPMGRIARLKRNVTRTFPYYILATLSHIHPFQVHFKTLWDTDMTCYLPEGNTFYYYGYCEANVANFLIRYLKKRMTIIDVGAHVGFYSMLTSELVGNSGSVHSFEPTPWTFRLLEENTKKLLNVTINNMAVAETAMTLSFADYGPGYGAYNSAHEKGASELGKSAAHIEVAGVSLDAYCIEHNITPSLIKIDSEGFEFEVLSGSKNILTGNDQSRPLLIMEVANGNAWAENTKKSFQFLDKKRYIAYEMSVEGFIRTHTFQENYEYDNLLFIPQERIEELTDLLA